MSEEKRYMDEGWDDLPLPDGDLAWQKMELLLDKEKERRVLPFWFWRYAGLGLLLMGISVGAWLWLGKGEEETQTSQTKQNEPPAKETTAGNKTSTPITPDQPMEETKKEVLVPRDQSSPNAIPSQHPGITKEQTTTANTNNTGARKRLQRPTKQPSAVTTNNTSPNTPSPVNDPSGKKDEPSTVNVPGPKQTTVDSSKITGVPPKDSIAKKDTVATKAAEPIASNEKKRDSGTKKPFVFTAGVGLQQAIAFGGQESSAYNYKGKQNSLSDRIPSVYLRLRKGRWFAQAEFQYAVPQPVKQFSFSQKTRYDVANLNLNTEQLTIRKLYYHQLPFSVNYFVLPNWSIGTGAMYSILAGAVTEQEVKSKNVQTGTESVARSIAPVQGYRDSFLYKSTAGILFQTDYHWKRISLGLRYTQNLEPFIKYTTPDGVVLDEKNRLLQAILRFRLF